MVTRYVLGGENRFAPHAEMENGIGYFLAVYAQKYGIEIYAVCFSGNHEHIVGCDVRGRMPAFTRDFHARIARHYKETYGEPGPMWDKRQTNHVKAINPEDTASRYTYVAANPVKHQFVEHAEDFPGFKRQWPAPPLTFRRPSWLNPKAKNPDGSLKWPETVILIIYRPRGFDHLSDAELAAHLATLLEEKEEAFRKEVIAKGGTFMGAAKVKRQSRHRRPSRRSRQKRRKAHRQVIPTISAADRETRKEVLEDDRRWRAQYRDRFERWQRGERDVVFPHGTYKMLHVHRVAVAPPPA